MKLTTDRHEASCGFSATADIIVRHILYSTYFNASVQGNYRNIAPIYTCGKTEIMVHTSASAGHKPAKKWGHLPYFETPPANFLLSCPKAAEYCNSEKKLVIRENTPRRGLYRHNMEGCVGCCFSYVRLQISGGDSGTDRREILHDGTHRSRTSSPLWSVPQGSLNPKFWAQILAIWPRIFRKR